MDKKRFKDLLKNYVSNSKDRIKIQNSLNYQFNFDNQIDEKITEKNGYFTINNLLKDFVLVKQNPNEEGKYVFGARVEDNGYLPDINGDQGISSKRERFFKFEYNNALLTKDEISVDDLCNQMGKELKIDHEMKTDFNGFKRYAIQNLSQVKGTDLIIAIRQNYK